MTELITEQVRAKSVSIAVNRVDKVGKRKNAKTRNHIVPLHGMASAKEAEKIGRDMANELGVSEDRVIVETYKKGQAPMESNPRHRIEVPRWNRPRQVREVVSKPFQVVRRVFSANTPKTDAEWQAHVDAFYERQKEFLNGNGS